MNYDVLSRSGQVKFTTLFLNVFFSSWSSTNLPNYSYANGSAIHSAPRTLPPKHQPTQTTAAAAASAPLLREGGSSQCSQCENCALCDLESEAQRDQPRVCSQCQSLDTTADDNADPASRPMLRRRSDSSKQQTKLLCGVPADSVKFIDSEANGFVSGEDEESDGKVMGAENRLYHAVSADCNLSPEAGGPIDNLGSQVERMEMKSLNSFLQVRTENVEKNRNRKSKPARVHRSKNSMSSLDRQIFRLLNGVLFSILKPSCHFFSYRNTKGMTGSYFRPAARPRPLLIVLLP